MDKKSNRVYGIDIAKGLAIFGMIFMNYKIAGKYLFSEPYNTNEITYSLLDNMSGRFGALFIFLAGMGVILMNWKALMNNDIVQLKINRRKLFKRSAFLLIIGMLFSLFWKADILHYYAFYIFIGSFLIKFKRRTLILLSIFCVIMFFILNLFLNWEIGWDFNTLEYVDLYTLEGFFKNLFFNGFHPIFPWMAFFLTGMAVAKSDLNTKSKNYLSIIVSIIVFVSVELLSFNLSKTIESKELYYLFSTNAMPPFFLFSISTMAMNIFALNLAIVISRIVSSNNIIIKSLINTGQFTMSHYVFHLFPGLYLLYVLNMIVEITVLSIFIYSVIYFIGAIYITQLWKKRFKHGPLETIMRKISNVKTSNEMELQDKVS